MSNYYTFPDHSNELFGRQPDIDYLLERINLKGLTAIAARPQMGKTWLLDQVGWKLEHERGYIVGYHESKGESDDHLLRAVLDLYRRWLSSASMQEQLESLFTRHKDKLITGVGRAIGNAFKELAPAGSLIKKTFDGLAAADHDLKTGGLELPSLDYDSALSLTRIVANEMESKPIVLILDAWEKSPSVQIVYNTLSAFLSRIDDWPHCHLLLGIRDPELHGSNTDYQALKLVKDLDNQSSSAKIWRLPSMHLEDQSEKDRLLDHTKKIAPAAQGLSDDLLLKTIDRFPGVIGRFRESEKLKQLDSEEGLLKLAQDAQQYRYREFDKLLPILKNDELKMAIRLAAFHRLDAFSWTIFRDVLCENISFSAWEELREKRVFEPLSYPTYGHDARYADAFRRLSDIRPDSVRYELEIIISLLAQRIQYIDERDSIFVAALAGLYNTAKRLRLGDISLALCQAAAGLFPQVDPYELNKIEAAVTFAADCDSKISFLVATALNNRGVRKGQLGDSEGAIADYTAIIDMADVPPDRRAQALNNRSVRRSQLGDNEGAIADFTAVIDMADALPDRRAQALYNRGVSKGQFGDSEAAIADFTAVIDMADAPPELRAKALEKLVEIQGHP